MSVPPTLAAEQGLLRQNIALSVIKQTAEQDQIFAKIIEESVRSAPVSSSRGATFNAFA